MIKRIICFSLVLTTFITIYITSASAENNEIRLPVVMYHQFSTNSNKCGKYILSIEQFEDDLKYLKEHNYQTISMAELTDYTDNGTPLPKNPIILTFDDGHLTFRTLVYPLLEKYDMCAVLSIIGELTDGYTENNDRNEVYAYLNWADVSELTAGGRVEIGCHTYALHKLTNGRIGCSKGKNENSEKYKQLLETDLNTFHLRLLEEAGTKTSIMTYPFGGFCKESEEFIKETGFKASFSCTERINKIKDSDDLFLLGRYNRPHGISSEKFFKKMGVE